MWLFVIIWQLFHWQVDLDKYLILIICDYLANYLTSIWSWLFVTNDCLMITILDYLKLIISMIMMMPAIMIVIWIFFMILITVIVALF